MGAQLSKALGRLFGSKEMRLLMLGLDAAGKTSMLSFPAPLSLSQLTASSKPSCTSSSSTPTSPPFQPSDSMSKR